MKAVHFGAGNIGRGFVGALLHEGGYEIVFSDVAGALVDAINSADRYTVHEVGAGGKDTEVTGFSAINSAENPDQLIHEISVADVVTTAVGPTVLPFVAEPILAALKKRTRPEPLQVMACENAIGATDQLRDSIAELAGEHWESLETRAVFANTAVDRIVPGQPEGGGIDVTVEPFFEWAIERAPFGTQLPNIPGAHFVDDLTPYVERKLFTVNTGHATAAYFGARAGHNLISEALDDPTIYSQVEATLAETSALLALKHNFDVAELAEYRKRILTRFTNPALQDTVWRVGRQPLRKLSRHDRFVGPAAEAAEQGLTVRALLGAISAALEFNSPDDEQSAKLQDLLKSTDSALLTTEVTGIRAPHPLYESLVNAFRTRAQAL